MLVDMHAHVIPGALDAVGASADHRGPRIGPCAGDEHARLLENDRGMQFKAIDAFYSAERRLEELERSGVDAEVVSPMPPLLDYALSGPEGLELSRRVNEFVASLCAADPGRLMGMGMVPMQAPELACAELARVQRCRARRRGDRLERGSAARSTAIEYEEFWAEAERLEMPIFIHAMPADFGERLPAGLIPIAAFAVGADALLACAGIITSGLAERHPRLRLAFSHGAGGFPMMLPRAMTFWGKTWNEEPPVCGGRGGLAGGAHAALLLRRARVRPARAALPDRARRASPGAGRLGLPGDAARGPMRADVAVARPAGGRARGHHLAQHVPLPRHRGAASSRARGWPVRRKQE